jgi:hypothetical protein
LLIEELLLAHHIALTDLSPGRHYTTCPECSSGRSTAAHRTMKCLGVTIEAEDKVFWGCNHCGMSGPQPKPNGGGGPELTAYVYRDAAGVARFRKVRNLPGREPRFWLEQSDGNDGWNKGTKGVDTGIIYRADEVARAIAAGRMVLVAEGEKDCDSLRALGFVATCNAHGASEMGKAPKWKPHHSAQLKGADVVVLNDNDAPGYAHADATCKLSIGVAKRVRRLDLALHWPNAPKGGDVSDWLAQGHTREELATLIEDARDYEGRATEPAPPEAPSKTLDEVVAAFQRWLLLDDLGPVYAVLGTVAANLLDGEPVWTGIIGPPSSAKTEILNALSRLRDVVAVGVLTMAGLLSGTPKHQKDSGAAGGLLRRIGAFGILALKDFGSILSMRQEARAELLGAMREIFDGAWTRHLGIDGGKTLHWAGKLGLVFCATQAFDDERAPIAALGDRFIVCRLAPPSSGQLRKALAHSGATLKTMRAELAEHVAGLFVAIKGRVPRLITDEEITRLERVVGLAVRLRGHVQRDRYSRDIENVHDPEGPSRVGLALERLLAGLDVIGLERETAMQLVEEIALASTPPLRRHAFALLSNEPKTTREIATALRISTTGGRRVLEDLVAQGLAWRERPKKEDGDEKQGGADLWTRTGEGYTLSDGLQGFEKAADGRSRIISQDKKRKIKDLFSDPAPSDSPNSSLDPAPSPGSKTREQANLNKSKAYEGRAPSAGEIVQTARGKGVDFVLALEHDLFSLEWRVPFDPATNQTITDNYDAILAWLVHEAEGLRAASAV